MKYIGIQQQIARNQRLSVLYLLAFPAIILLVVYLFLLAHALLNAYDYPTYNHNEAFFQVAPWVVLVVGIWFIIAYYTNTALIQAVTSSHTLSRKENMRVYNLVENLCMQEGMPMPKIHVIDDPGLNAFASGINQRTYTITLTRGLIDTLNDEELQGVIAHELMHIKNKDVQLLIITIVFVGILSFSLRVLLRNFFWAGRSRRDKKLVWMQIIAIILLALAFLLSMIFKFGLSRSREYLADSGAAEMTKNPLALASALRKISRNPIIKSVKSDDIKQMYIEHPPQDSMGFMGIFSGLFATHPPIEKRIRLLEQF